MWTMPDTHLTWCVTAQRLLWCLPPPEAHFPFEMHHVRNFQKAKEPHQCISQAWKSTTRPQAETLLMWVGEKGVGLPGGFSSYRRAQNVCASVNHSRCIGRFTLYYGEKKRRLFLWCIFKWLPAGLHLFIWRTLLFGVLFKYSRNKLGSYDWLVMRKAKE